jgi:soluble lytic murein transglycosylase-like protein
MKRYLFASSLSLLLLASGGLSAGQLYRFQDADGNVLLTNQVDKQRKPLHQDRQQYRRLVKVTWYPDTNVHSYRNWGKTEMAVKASASKNRNAFDDNIRLAAEQYDLDFGLIKAVIHTESGFDPKARSGPGAQGLMQLMPATAKRYRVTDAWDPAQNINAGAKHLRYLLKRYGDLSLALAAYNAGEGNVDKYGGIPPFTETQDYVERVTGRYTRLYGGSLAAN